MTCASNAPTVHPQRLPESDFSQRVLWPVVCRAGGKLVTSIPWEPGRRELKFTYFLHNTSSTRVWERTLDLPTERLQVRVATTAPDQVTCNLDRAG